MSPIIGHETVRKILERNLPPVTLLHGPESIGKWTLAVHLARYHEVSATDLYQLPDGMRVPDSHDLLAWSYIAPNGPFKLAVVNMDQTIAPAFHLLLKTIEEPPRGVRFLFTSSRLLPDTFTSRCIVYTLNALTPDQLRQVLLAQGVSKPVAARQSHIGRGQVGPALARAADSHIEPVLGLVRAIAKSDAELFAWAIDQTNAGTRDLLHRWLVEAMTGQRVLFTDEEMFSLDRQPDLLNKMMARLSMAPAAPARLQVRVALEPFLAT